MIIDAYLLNDLNDLKRDNETDLEPQGVVLALILGAGCELAVG